MGIGYLMSMYGSGNGYRLSDEYVRIWPDQLEVLHMADYLVKLGMTSALMFTEIRVDPMVGVRF